MSTLTRQLTIHEVLDPLAVLDFRAELGVQPLDVIYGDAANPYLSPIARWAYRHGVDLEVYSSTVYFDGHTYDAPYWMTSFQVELCARTVRDQVTARDCLSALSAILA